MDLGVLANITIEDMSPEKACQLLALTASRQDEVILRKDFETKYGYRTAVTEAGGVLGGMLQSGKLVNAGIAAALNAKVVRKTAHDLHAVGHAVLEAQKCITLDGADNASVACKIAVVTDGKWLAAGIFAKVAVHMLDEHRRAGIGVVHF